MVVIKKLGSALMLIAGLLSSIGAFISMVGSGSMRYPEDDSFNMAINGAVFARVCVIVVFAAAIAVIAAAFLTPGAKKGGAITAGVFALVEFIGQFLIDPFTSSDKLLEAALSQGSADTGASAFIGLVMIVIAGIAVMICGIVGLASKVKKAQ